MLAVFNIYRLLYGSSYWHWCSHIGPRAYMAIQCHYDLEAHLGHIITYIYYMSSKIDIVTNFRRHVIIQSNQQMAY